MPTKIRLQRKGKRGRPFYHIVIADGRAPRDGKFVEKIGTYNTLTKPVEIEIDFDRAVYWLQSGAQPSDTVRSILSYKGVLYKNHLLTGVRKGALTEDQAEMKFQEWMKTKQEKILESIKETSLSKKEQKKKRLAAEAKVNETRVKELAAKRAKELKEMRKEDAEEVTAEVTEEVPATVSEEVVAEVAPPEEIIAEVAAAEVTEEVPATVSEEVVAEVAQPEEVIAEVAAAEEVTAEEVTAEEVAAEATPAETEEIIAEAAPESEPTAETTETKTEAEA